jgi:regulator of PEP synthase PpsR (kinase-PPPase family)
MNPLTIYIVSGGTGASGEQLVRTMLAQFQNVDIPIIIVPQIHDASQLEQVVSQAASTDGMIVHTLVDANLREQIADFAHDYQVIHFDLVGSLLNHLQMQLRQQPLGQPGLYRKLREHDLKRIEAIEFTVDHDDGQRIHDLHRAEIVLTGVSRVGKTPLSVYLSTLGWKVANVPLVKGINPPPILFEVDCRRVIGLTLEPGQLVAYRQRRQHHLGVGSSSLYTEPAELLEELEFARQIFRQGQFAVFDMTDKPVEESAQEIIIILARRSLE